MLLPERLTFSTKTILSSLPLPVATIPEADIVCIDLFCKYDKNVFNVNGVLSLFIIEKYAIIFSVVYFA